MTDENSQTTDAPIPQTFGKRLKSAREDLRLDVKDVASQLRLRVSIIDMLEKEMYSDDTPTTFLRGYLRSYAKFLEIPESELNSALSAEPFQPKIEQQHAEATSHAPEYQNINKFIGYADKSLNGILNKNTYTIISTSSKYSFRSMSYLFKFLRKYFMPLFTGVIIFTMGYLVLTWWNSHKNSVIIPPLAETQLTTPAATTGEANIAAVTPVQPTQALTHEAAPTTLAEAEDQDMEATLDDEPAIFEEDSSPKTTAVAKPAATLKKPIVTAQLQQKKVIDIYNE